MMPEEGKAHEGPQDNHQSGQNIVSGANDESQLDKFKENIPEGGRESYPEKQAGTTPDAYQYERQEGDSNQSNDQA